MVPLYTHLVPLYGAPLPAQAPGVAPRQQRRAARRALRVRVVAVQHHASRRVSKHSTCHNVSRVTLSICCHMSHYLSTVTCNPNPIYHVSPYRPRLTAGDSGLFQGTSAQPRSSTTMVTMWGGAARPRPGTSSQSSILAWQSALELETKAIRRFTWTFLKLYCLRFTLGLH